MRFYYQRRTTAKHFQQQETSGKHFHLRKKIEGKRRTVRVGGGCARAQQKGAGQTKSARLGPRKGVECAPLRLASTQPEETSKIIMLRDVIVGGGDLFTTWRLGKDRGL